MYRHYVKAKRRHNAAVSGRSERSEPAVRSTAKLCRAIAHCRHLGATPAPFKTLASHLASF